MNISHIEPLEARTLLSTYYVGTSGNDLHSGTSPSTAWRSIAKVNAVAFHPGDKILFQGGQTFGGSIKPRVGGTASQPITFGTFGSQRAIINSGKSDGAYLLNKQGVWFSYLKFVGTPNGKSHDGIHLETTTGDEQNVGVFSCQISGYGFAGIHVRSNGAYGFVGLNINNNSIHDIADDGVLIESPVRNVHRNAHIAHNDVYSIYGDASSTSSGNGMVLGCLNGAVVERNTLHQNGGKAGDGGAGIWTFGSTGIFLQYNEAYQNHSQRGNDGDGLDFDADTQNSVMQYNYSHDNDGAGLMFDQWKGNPYFTNDVMRYNVSQNNARRNLRYAGISVFGQVANCRIYNNSVYESVGPDSVGVRIRFSALGGSYVNGLRLANNIIMTTGGRALIDVAGNEVHGSNLTFAGNDYWSSGSAAKFIFGKTYGSLSSWQSATGQEKLNGKSVGFFADPKLNAAGQGGTLGADNLAKLSAYKLQSGSPLINRGINAASLFGGPGVSHDFYGDHVPQGSGYEIGVDEVVGR